MRSSEDSRETPRGLYYCSKSTLLNKTLFWELWVNLDQQTHPGSFHWCSIDGRTDLPMQASVWILPGTPKLRHIFVLSQRGKGPPVGRRPREIGRSSVHSAERSLHPGQRLGGCGRTPSLTGKGPALAGRRPDLTREGPALTGRRLSLKGRRPGGLGRTPSLTGRRSALSGRASSPDGRRLPAENRLPAQAALGCLTWRSRPAPRSTSLPGCDRSSPLRSPCPSPSACTPGWTSRHRRVRSASRDRPS